MYQTHQLYFSDPSTIYNGPINYIKLIYIKYMNQTYQLNIYQTHQTYESDPSTKYVSDQSTIHIRPIVYI